MRVTKFHEIETHVLTASNSADSSMILSYSNSSTRCKLWETWKNSWRIQQEEETPEKNLLTLQLLFSVWLTHEPEWIIWYQLLQDMR